MPRRDRVLAYDALRVLAILAVIAIHTLMPYRETADAHSFMRVLDDLLHFAVPLFVFVSGVFVWGRQLPDTFTGWRAFFSRRAATIGIPYLVWSSLYMSLAYLRATGGLGASRSVAFLLSGNTWYHLYFVPMMLAFYLLTPAVAWLLRRSPGALVIGAYALWIVWGPAVTRAVDATLGHSAWSFATHVITHLPHMALGAWFARRGEALPRRGWLATLLTTAGVAVMAAASMGATSALPDALQRTISGGAVAATVIGLTLGALAAEPFLARSRRPILIGAALSFGVYLVHPVALLAVRSIAERLSGPSATEHLWYAPSVFAATAAGSFLVAALLARSRATRGLVGLPPATAQTAVTPVTARSDAPAAGYACDAA